MPLTKKRKITPPPEEDIDTVAHLPAEVEDTAASGAVNTVDQALASTSKVSPTNGEQAKTQSAVTDPAASSTDTNSDRAARFAALKARATASSRSNLAETKAEASRSAVNPELLANLSRKAAVAQHNLLKTDTEEEDGKGAFERKRAWDYTIEESERWDERVSRKKEARNNNVFQDYGREAGKIYDRQLREMGWREGGGEGGEGARSMKDNYDQLKTEMVETAVRSGGLEVVELANGELVAIDKDGTFYSGSDTGFTEQKPKKENVDRLVADLRKAEDVRLRKRRERRGKDGEDDGDVTYINDKNKQFNLKLARFYDRYTGDIRESFERGTAI